MTTTTHQRWSVVINTFGSFLITLLIKAVIVFIVWSLVAPEQASFWTVLIIGFGWQLLRSIEFNLGFSATITKTRSLSAQETEEQYLKRFGVDSTPPIEWIGESEAADTSPETKP